LEIMREISYLLVGKSIMLLLPVCGFKWLIGIAIHFFGPHEISMVCTPWVFHGKVGLHLW